MSETAYRITVADFNDGKRTTVTAAVWQWSTGQWLRLSLPALPESYRVDFSNQKIHDYSKPQIGGPDGVGIPDEYFISGKPVYAFIVLSDGKGDSGTEYMAEIPVTPRSRPTNYEPTPVEKSVIDQTIAAANTAREAAEDAADQAKASSDAVADATAGTRVTSLDETGLESSRVIEAVGIPVYVDDVTQYDSFGIEDTGWYIFARITAPTGVTVGAEASVTGAAGVIMAEGDDHVDVAVKFEVAAVSQKVTVDWGEETESFVFKSTDLAIRNLDYRVTFYVYDIAPFCTWTYTAATDATFAAGKYYYTKDENDVYTLAEVTVGEAIPADTYYVHSKLTIEGMTRNITYNCETPIDCPIEIILPEIEDEVHGAWFEIRFQHTGSYSSTLTVPEGVKVATEHTQPETAGMNTVDLHYSTAGEVKIWRFLNTHSSIPA